MGAESAWGIPAICECHSSGRLRSKTPLSWVEKPLGAQQPLAVIQRELTWQGADFLLGQLPGQGDVSGLGRVRAAAEAQVI